MSSQSCWVVGGRVQGILSDRDAHPHVRVLADTAGPQVPTREDPAGRKSPLEGMVARGGGVALTAPRATQSSLRGA